MARTLKRQPYNQALRQNFLKHGFNTVNSVKNL